MRKLVTLFLVSGLLLFNSGCEEMLTLTFDANFPVDLNINITDTKAKGDYPFTDSGSLNIEDDEEVLEYIEKIKELEITAIECTLTGIQAWESIKSLTFTVVEAGFTSTLLNLTENTTITLPVNSETLNALSTFLFNNHQITINVNGVSSYAPMVLGVKLNFISKVTAAV
jgi:hypothetical protein